MSAPLWNSVDVFKGEVRERPSQFFTAMSEADEHFAELERARELAVRVDELLEELAEVKDRNSRLVNTIAAMRTQLDRVTQERDTAKLVGGRQL